MDQVSFTRYEVIRTKTGRYRIKYTEHVKGKVLYSGICGGDKGRKYCYQSQEMADRQAQEWNRVEAQREVELTQKGLI